MLLTVFVFLLLPLLKGDLRPLFFLPILLYPSYNHLLTKNNTNQIIATIRISQSKIPLDVLTSFIATTTRINIKISKVFIVFLICYNCGRGKTLYHVKNRWLNRKAL
nr:MAG TPA: hypothetical protein [Caudoviricetes sp.]